MVGLTFINPLDQPTGRHRLLTDLKDSLQDKTFSRFRFRVERIECDPEALSHVREGPTDNMIGLTRGRQPVGVLVPGIGFFGPDWQLVALIDDGLQAAIQRRRRRPAAPHSKSGPLLLVPECGRA